MGLLQTILQNGQQQKQLDRLKELDDRRAALEQFHTLREITNDPNAVRRDALFNYWGGTILGKDNKPALDTFRKILKDADENDLKLFQGSLDSMGMDIASGNMSVRDAFGLLKDPLKAFQFVRQTATERETKKILTEGESGAAPSQPTMPAADMSLPDGQQPYSGPGPQRNTTMTPGPEMAPPQPPQPPTDPHAALEAAIDTWRNKALRLRAIGASKESVDGAEKNVTLLENRLTRMRDAYQLKGTDEAGNPVDRLVSKDTKQVVYEQKGARGGQTLAERVANARAAYSTNPGPETKGALGRAEDALKIEKEIKAAEAAATVAAQNATKPLDDQDKQAINAHNNILASVRMFKDFTPEEVRAYSGLLNRPANEAKVALQNMAPSTFGAPDERFLQFKSLMGRLQGTAFGEAGKQLTGTELAVVSQYTPTGRELGGAAEISAKINNLETFTRLARATRLRLANQSKGQVDPDELDKAIEDAARRAGLLRKPGGPSPKGSDVDAARKRLGLD